MHFVDAKGILTGSGGAWGMNIYRGCTHGCVYCDSRSLCYRFTHPFEDVEVKQNALSILDCYCRLKSLSCVSSILDFYLKVSSRVDREYDVALHVSFILLFRIWNSYYYISLSCLDAGVYIVLIVLDINISS